jgi:uncharacterized protein (DUF1330 family)
LTQIEGAKPDASVVGILQFPSMDALQAFVSDPDYAPYAAVRQREPLLRH